MNVDMRTLRAQVAISPSHGVCVWRGRARSVLRRPGALAEESRQEAWQEVRGLEAFGRIRQVYLANNVVISYCCNVSKLARDHSRYS
eukprot:644311-Amphidinium_carterae.1